MKFPLRFYISVFISATLFWSCGNQKKLSQAGGSKSKPGIEHEFLKKDPDGNWVVPDESVTRAEENENSATPSLSDFIEDWYGTPHVMGGNTKKGVDCSGFVIQAYLQVFKQNFRGRRAEDLFAEIEPLKKSELQYGDLVFFKIRGRRIDHVGIYLQDGNFVHVSSSNGVMVSKLSNPYFSKRFFRGGRKF